MRVLVTGGAGFVGSVLTPQLLEAGYETVVFDSLRGGGNSLLPWFRHPSFEFIRGDVRDPDAVRAGVAGCDAVVHLAAIVGYPACRKFPEEAQQTNVDGVRNVVAALDGAQSLVYASTGSNYGQLDETCTEDSPLNPLSHYGVTKTEAERITLERDRSTALRFATAFGVSPRMRLDLLVNDFVRMAVIDKQIICYERHFRRSFVHVTDMGRAIIFALNQMDDMTGRPFNVGHESMNLTKEQIARKIQEFVPFYLHFAEIGTDADKRDYEVSYDKIRRLGFETKMTLDEGIRELIRAMEVLELDHPYSNL
ncbi:MAG: NAD(P)-dependent oxidoreductase [Pirellulaceae bacterium]|jgi:nucleoside-diphosphate-sugar epimerase|nr:NAD(P)-dependent oxidoreductase [Pirellulaceae bacterium]